MGHPDFARYISFFLQEINILEPPLLNAAPYSQRVLTSILQPWWIRPWIFASCGSWLSSYANSFLHFPSICLSSDIYLPRVVDIMVPYPCQLCEPPTPCKLFISILIILSLPFIFLQFYRDRSRLFWSSLLYILVNYGRAHNHLHP